MRTHTHAGAISTKGLGVFVGRTGALSIQRSPRVFLRRVSQAFRPKAMVSAGRTGALSIQRSLRVGLGRAGQAFRPKAWVSVGRTGALSGHSDPKLGFLQAEPVL